MSSKCIQNFLNKIHHSSAERHSDSSDFDVPSKYFRIAAKIAIHTTPKTENKKTKKKDIEICKVHVSNRENNPLDFICKSFEGGRTLKENMQANSSDLSLCIKETLSNHGVRKSHGEVNIVRDYASVQQENPEKLISRLEESQVLNSIESYKKYNKYTNSTGTDYFKICESRAKSKAGIVKRKKQDALFWHPKKMKKVGLNDDNYYIHPIYVMERIEHNNKKVTQNEETSEQTVLFYNSNRSISFAESEKEIFKRSYRVLSSAVSKQNDQNEMNGKENSNIEKDSIKRNISTPDRMSPTYKSKSILTDLTTTCKLTSSSTAFWNFLSDKVHRKRKMCPCDDHNVSCIKGLSEISKPAPEESKSRHELLSDVKISEINQTEFLGKDKDCQCDYGPFQLETLSDEQQNETKSQGKHEAIAKALSEKYKGEILCIHNPPCVLLNGCLNMCSKQSGHSQFWPILTKRRIAFGHRIKKVKHSKEKHDQSTYQPSFSKLEECLPEFKMGVQHRRSPCQVFHFHGTKGFKMKTPYHKPKVSLNHLKDEISFQQNTDTKIPVCSNVYVVVNTNENVTSRVVTCPHKPPCLLIPKCLARFITSNYVQVNSVPDCTHVPYCEKIPACFGNKRSENSKSSCRIV